MTDDLTKKRPQDATKINIHEPYEVNHWCEHFNITPEKLKAAVKKVGVMVADVQKELKR